MKLVTFFAGAGGLDWGFSKAGFDVIWAVDNWQPAVKTHKKNHPISHTICDDVLRIASLPDDELQAEQVIQLFCKTLDLSKATERINEIKESKAKLQEKVNAQIEQSKQAQMERENVVPSQTPFETHQAQNKTEPRRYCVFRFEGSMSELQAFNPILNKFIREHNVKVTIVEKGEC